MVNVKGRLPQLVRIIRTRNIEGLSLAMFVLYFLVQVAFSIEGFFKKNRMLMVCMGLSAVVSSVIIGLVTYLRHFGGWRLGVFWSSRRMFPATMFVQVAAKFRDERPAVFSVRRAVD